MTKKTELQLKTVRSIWGRTVERSPHRFVWFQLMFSGPSLLLPLHAAGTPSSPSPTPHSPLAVPSFATAAGVRAVHSREEKQLIMVNFGPQLFWIQLHTSQIKM